MGAQDRTFAPLLRVVNEAPRDARPRRPSLDGNVAGVARGRGMARRARASSVEWQARAAWDDLLAEFATLGSVTRRLHRGEAVAALVALARDKVFQPESPRRPFRSWAGSRPPACRSMRLWVAGLAAERWPPAPRPNPLLPLAWQRERNVPRSTAARELAYAQALTQEWARAAPEVVFSCAVMADDHPRTMSSLVATATPRPSRRTGSHHGARAIRPRACTRNRRRRPRADLREWSHPGGGAGLIAAQGNCPFQAMARYRLRTDTWPAPVDGLSPIERGILVHAAVAAFLA